MSVGVLEILILSAYSLRWVVLTVGALCLFYTFLEKRAKTKQQRSNFASKDLNKGGVGSEEDTKSTTKGLKRE